MTIPHYQIYIGGQFVDGSTSLTVTNPYTNQVIATTTSAGKDELERAIQSAEDVRDELWQLPAWKRFAILREISDALITKQDELALLLCRESGKPLRYAKVEIQRAAQTFLVAAEESKRLPQEYIRLDWTNAGTGREGLVKYFPIGLVAGIAPFNFPMNLAVHKIAPAIAAGCPIVLKPASAAPLSTLALAQIIAATDLPKGAVSILPMNRDTGNQLVTDDRFALLSFTGSPEIGWKMKQQAGRKKVVLELGGNAGVIVSEYADLEFAVSRGVEGGFAYSGQICIHAQRFFVQEKIFQRFTELFVKQARQLRKGNPEHEDTDISVMIDEANAIRVEQWVNEAVADGAKVLLGGQRDGTYLPPFVLTQTTAAMKVVCEEVFGPVVIIESYTTFKNAIQQINSTRFGLQAGVFTTNIHEMDAAFEYIEAGGIILNDVPTFRIDHMPYGGIKDSGLGREGVTYAIRDMLEPRILVK
jgi:glyceraldehyde-3-phosphate dehydrogenase (NADP+)